MGCGASNEPNGVADPKNKSTS